MFLNVALLKLIDLTLKYRPSVKNQLNYVKNGQFWVAFGWDRNFFSLLRQVTT